VALENDPKSTAEPKDEQEAGEEKAAEEKAAEVKAAEEKVAGKEPAGEKPAEEKPAEEKPAEEKPADEASEPAKAEAAEVPIAASASEEAPAEPAAAAPVAPPAYPIIRGARWAEPIAGFERRWTWLESRLLTFVLIWQLVALVAWVLLSGISSPPSAGDASGTAFRSAFAALLLGVFGWVGSRKLPLTQRRILTISGIVLGVLIGLVLRPAPSATSGVRFAVNRALGLDRLDAAVVSYFSNLRSWLQDGSTLTLMGGLRGLATRLTLWLALLGASLATAAGKHIHIDVIFRFLPKRLRVPAAIINFCAAAAVCFAGVWGFFDHIAIESFEAKADDAAGAKIGRVAHHMGRHFFLARKQIGLDLRTLPHVLAGDRYDQWMTPQAWNAWVKDAGFEGSFTADEVKTILVPEDSSPHPPLVISPDGAATRGILVHDLNLVFPFGLLVIGLRFLLRALLTLSGHIPVDPDAAHKEEISGAKVDTPSEPAGDAAKTGGV
jgi:hypothetical protein